MLAKGTVLIRDGYGPGKPVDVESLPRVKGACAVREKFCETYPLVEGTQVLGRDRTTGEVTWVDAEAVSVYQPDTCRLIVVGDESVYVKDANCIPLYYFNRGGFSHTAPSRVLDVQRDGKHNSIVVPRSKYLNTADNVSDDILYADGKSVKFNFSLGYAVGYYGVLGGMEKDKKGRRSITLGMPPIKYGWSRKGAARFVVRSLLDTFGVSSPVITGYPRKFTRATNRGEGMFYVQDDGSDAFENLWGFLCAMTGHRTMPLFSLSSVFKSTGSSTRIGVLCGIIAAAGYPGVNKYGTPYFSKSHLSLNRAAPGSLDNLYGLIRSLGIKSYPTVSVTSKNVKSLSISRDLVDIIYRDNGLFTMVPGMDHGLSDLSASLNPAAKQLVPYPGDKILRELAIRDPSDGLQVTRYNTFKIRADERFRLVNGFGVTSLRALRELESYWGGDALPPLYSDYRRRVIDSDIMWDLITVSEHEMWLPYYKLRVRGSYDLATGYGTFLNIT